MLRAVALALSLAAPAAATTQLTEPIQPPENPLIACVYYLGGSQTANWLKATKPTGGGTIPLKIPSSQIPTTIKAICMAQSTLSDGRWSAPVTGTVFVGIK